jgi:hypothetical protein
VVAALLVAAMVAIEFFGKTERRTASACFPFQCAPRKRRDFGSIRVLPAQDLAIAATSPTTQKNSHSTVPSCRVTAVLPSRLTGANWTLSLGAAYLCRNLRYERASVRRESRCRRWTRTNWFSVWATTAALAAASNANRI